MPQRSFCLMDLNMTKIRHSLILYSMYIHYVIVQQYAKKVETLTRNLDVTNLKKQLTFLRILSMDGSSQIFDEDEMYVGTYA